MNTRLIAFVSALADAVLAAAAGLCPPLVLCTIVWFARGDAVEWGLAYAAAAAAWGLSLGSPAVISIDPAAVPALAQPLSFPVTVAPLGLAIVPAILAWRTGLRGRRGDGSPLPVLAAAICFAGLIGTGLGAVQTPGVAVDPLRGAIGGLLLYLATAAAGLAVWRRLPGGSATLERALPIARAVARAAAVSLAALACAASLLLAVTVCAAMGRILTVSQALQLDAGGALALGAGQLAYVPNAVAWTMAWLVGPGFQAGAGSSFSPFGTVATPLPLVPLLAALPGPIPAPARGLLLLPVAAAAAGTVRLRFDAARLGFEHGWRRIAWPLAAAVCAALAVALAAAASRGSGGPGLLGAFGPDPLAVFAGAFGCFAVGALAGALLPAGVVERVRSLLPAAPSPAKPENAPTAAKKPAKRKRPAPKAASERVGGETPAVQRPATSRPAVKNPVSKGAASKDAAAKDAAAKGSAAKGPGAKGPEVKGPGAKRPAAKGPGDGRPAVRNGSTGASSVDGGREDEGPGRGASRGRAPGGKEPEGRGLDEKTPGAPAAARSAAVRDRQEQPAWIGRAVRASTERRERDGDARSERSKGDGHREPERPEPGRSRPERSGEGRPKREPPRRRPRRHEPDIYADIDPLADDEPLGERPRGDGNG